MRGNNDTCPVIDISMKCRAYSRESVASRIIGIITSSMAFSWTCQPNINEVNPQSIIECRKARGPVGFSHKCVIVGYNKKNIQYLVLYRFVTYHARILFPTLTKIDHPVLLHYLQFSFYSLISILFDRNKEKKCPQKWQHVWSNEKLISQSMYNIALQYQYT